jgi:coenzyme F420 hydrogenase subunit beta
MGKIDKLMDVRDWRLCLGCGACAYICPDQKVHLVDYAAEGIRPAVNASDCGDCRLCLDVCPAVQSDFQRAGFESSDGFNAAFTKQWGPVLALWEGHATDPEIRFKGSSGGALTALSAYCVEMLGFHGVLHIGQDPDDAIRNCTRLSRTRKELVAATGSRYSPASVGNGLGLVEDAPSPCAIIGKPAEIAAVRNARGLRPELDQKVGLTMSFFCAESPATQGTENLLKQMGVETSVLRDLRYRGLGWPGHFAPTCDGDTGPRQKMTYRHSWTFLQAYRPWSVQLWPDGSGELADISCGDPWYEEPDGKNPGFSLVVARTKRGREIIEGAIAAGYLTLTPAESWKLAKSQSGLAQKKGAVWGRRLALRLCGLPVTRLAGLDLWSCWRQLSVPEQIRSVLGSVRRIFARKLYRRLELNLKEGVPVKVPSNRSKVYTIPKEQLAPKVS